MTGCAGGCTTMARRPRAVALVILALVATGECLNCKVCIPSANIEDKQSLEQAVHWRANISRTFPNKAESEIEECGSEAARLSAGESCPWKTDTGVVCLKAEVLGKWYALSCGRIPEDSDISCQHINGVEVCPCTTNYCNNRSWRSVVASAMLVATLVSATLAAGW